MNRSDFIKSIVCLISPKVYIGKKKWVLEPIQPINLRLIGVMEKEQRLRR